MGPRAPGASRPARTPPHPAPCLLRFVRLMPSRATLHRPALQTPPGRRPSRRSDQAITRKPIGPATPRNVSPLRSRMPRQRADAQSFAGPHVGSRTTLQLFRRFAERPGVDLAPPYAHEARSIGVRPVQNLRIGEAESCGIRDWAILRLPTRNEVSALLDPSLQGGSQAPAHPFVCTRHFSGPQLGPVSERDGLSGDDNPTDSDRDSHRRIAIRLAWDNGKEHGEQQILIPPKVLRSESVWVILEVVGRQRTRLIIGGRGGLGARIVCHGQQRTRWLGHASPGSCLGAGPRLRVVARQPRFAHRPNRATSPLAP